MHFYILTKKDQKGKLNNIIYHYIRRNKIGINLSKEAKELYSKNYKTLMKESKDDTDGRYIMFLYWKNQYCQNNCTTQGKLQIQCNPYQITNDIFHRNRTKI